MYPPATRTNWLFTIAVALGLLLLLGILITLIIMAVEIGTLKDTAGDIHKVVKMAEDVLPCLGALCPGPTAAVAAKAH